MGLTHLQLPISLVKWGGEAVWWIHRIWFIQMILEYLPMFLGLPESKSIGIGRKASTTRIKPHFRFPIRQNWIARSKYGHKFVSGHPQPQSYKCIDFHKSRSAGTL